MLQFYIKGYAYVLCVCDALFSEDNVSQIQNSEPILIISRASKF